MNMIDHLSLGVNNLSNISLFYRQVLATLGYECLVQNESFAAFGKDKIQFLLMAPLNGQAANSGNGTHVCFIAPSKAAVKAFHAYALANGGQCEGEPGPRPGYPTPDVYTCFVRDPEGHKLEAIFHGFQ